MESNEKGNSEKDSGNKEETQKPSGLLSRTVYSVASNAYSIGSASLVAGFTGIRWVTQTTITVGSAVVNSSTAQASKITSKFTKSGKEHSD